MSLEALKVKVRGHRVELEEIESVLRRCPGVAEAAVVSAVVSTEVSSTADEARDVCARCRADP